MQMRAELESALQADLYRTMQNRRATHLAGVQHFGQGVSLPDTVGLTQQQLVHGLQPAGAGQLELPPRPRHSACSRASRCAPRLPAACQHT